MLRTGPAALGAKAGATALATVLGTAGLAVAGVDLPDPADEAFQRVGLQLPNQANGDGGVEQAAERSRADEVRAVIEATDPSERDCEFGHRVAEAAKGEPLPDAAQDACERDEENGGGDAGANGGGDSAGRAFGEETSRRARELKDATPEQRRQFGRETSERAKQLGQRGRPDGAPQGRPDGTPSGPPAAAPQGKPDGTPSGPPAGAPQGRPDETPSGPPAGAPQGKPEGTPGGKPEGTPGGKPEGTPGGRP